MKKLIAISLGAAALAIAGCGSSDSNDTGAGTGTGTTTGASDVPSSALQSSQGLVSYLQQQIDSSTSDTGEPVVVGDVVLPTDDSTETSL